MSHYASWWKTLIVKNEFRIFSLYEYVLIFWLYHAEFNTMANFCFSSCCCTNRSKMIDTPSCLKYAIIYLYVLSLILFFFSSLISFLFVEMQTKNHIYKSWVSMTSNTSDLSSRSLAPKFPFFIHWNDSHSLPLKNLWCGVRALAVCIALWIGNGHGHIPSHE